MRSSRPIAVFGLLFFIARCDCSGGKLRMIAPEIAVSPSALAFGGVPVGATKLLTITVSNAGTGELDLGAVDIKAPFSVDWPAGGIMVPPGSSTGIDVGYLPTDTSTSSGTLVIHSNDAKTPALSITLSGHGVTGALTVMPPLIDLNTTTVGTSRGKRISIRSSVSAPVTGTLKALDFARPEHFSLTGLSSFATPAPTTVPANGSLALLLSYRPLVAGRDDGRIQFEYCGPGCGLLVRVSASAVSSDLRVQPSTLNFGTVSLGRQSTMSVQVFNDSRSPVQIGSAGVSSTDLQGPGPQAIPIAIPPGGSAPIAVTYTPSGPGALSADLDIGASYCDDPNCGHLRPPFHIAVAITGVGAGPQLAIQPPTVDFGITSHMTQELRPFLIVNSGDGQAAVTSISIAGDPAFVLTRLPGLPSTLAGGDSLTAYVGFTPNGIGVYTATITVSSDDMTNPTITALARAAFDVAHCQLTFTPGRVNFGAAPQGLVSTATVTIQNTGPSDCHLLSGAFSPSDPTITLAPTSWPIDVPPSGSAQLVFHFAPMSSQDAHADFWVMTDDRVDANHRIPVDGTVFATGTLDVIPAPHAEAAYAVLSDQLWVISGTPCSNGCPLPPMTRVDIIDPTLPAGARWSQGPSIQHARGWYSRAVNLNGTLYLFGGTGPNGVLVQEIERLDPGASAWVDAGVIPTASYLWIAARAKDKILLVFDDLSANLYDPGSGTLTRVADCPVGTVLAAATNVVGSDGQEYVVVYSMVSDNAAAFSVGQQTWSTWGGDPAGTMPVLPFTLVETCAASSNGKVFTAGNEGGEPSVVVIDPVAQTIRPSNVVLPEPRSDVACGVIGSLFYVAGGILPAGIAGLISTQALNPATF
jgi:hypothetical protein